MLDISVQKHGLIPQPSSALELEKVQFYFPGSAGLEQAEQIAWRSAAPITVDVATDRGV